MKAPAGTRWYGPIAAAGLALAAATGLAEVADPAITTTVTAQLYSGVPNPRAELTAAEQARMAKIIADLALHAIEDPGKQPAFRYGYGGFFVGHLPATEHGRLLGLRVYRRYVQVGGAAPPSSPRTVTYYHDEARSLELFCFEVMDKRGAIPDHRRAEILSEREAWITPTPSQ